MRVQGERTRAEPRGWRKGRGGVRDQEAQGLRVTGLGGGTDDRGSGPVTGSTVGNPGKEGD